MTTMSERRAALAADLKRLGIEFIRPGGGDPDWTITLGDGTEAHATLSQAEWYATGIADGINRVAQGLADSPLAPLVGGGFASGEVLP